MTTPTTTTTCTWVGQTGQRYVYYVFPIGANFTNPEPGNYIFTRLDPGGYVALYVGQTADVSERFDNHHALPCVKAHGGTHIHVRLNHSGLTARLNEETDIRRNYNPTCNRQ